MGYSSAPACTKLKNQLVAKHPKMAGRIGIMADARHIAGGTSDHIKGNAIDIPLVFAVSVMMALIKLLLLDPRCHYIIFNGMFYHPGKAPAKYTGSNPHKSHAHMSIIVAKRADDQAWKIEASKPEEKPMRLPCSQAFITVPKAKIDAFARELKAYHQSLMNSTGTHVVIRVHYSNSATAEVGMIAAKHGAVIEKVLPAVPGDTSVRELNPRTMRFIGADKR